MSIVELGHSFDFNQNLVKTNKVWTYICYQCLTTIIQTNLWFGCKRYSAFGELNFETLLVYFFGKS